ncbi:MAG: co-chaperone DjlA [Steroidobacteraceae bacterium]|nr:co-chaperone DjlA [Steroidobacteraceae bacterium]
MNWIGKIVGAIAGYLLTRRPVGVLIGMVLGHLFDQYAARRRGGARADPAAVRAVFFRTAFGVMGHVAKADGRVSEQDIAAARRIFRQFHLGEADTRAAMEFYSSGKGAGYDLDGALAELANACRGREEVLRMFLEIQLRAALLGDGLQGAARALLVRVAGVLGIGALEFTHLEILARLQAQAAGFTPGGAGGARDAPRRDSLADAYEVLEVPRGATDAEVKRAYRRLMSKNHPDKLVARGLPESMLEVAKEKTQAIQAAYERIRESRGMR